MTRDGLSYRDRMNIDEVRRGYDLVAPEYTRRLADELDNKPYDRAWLAAFAERVPEGGRIVELACGDGHVADYLKRSTSLGIEGLDLSPNMIECARSRYPEIEFRVGDLLALPYDDASVDALVCFYGIVNLAAPACQTAFSEMARALRPGGMLTLAFHVGDRTQRVVDWWGTGADLDFFFHDTARVRAQLREASFDVELAEERQPYDQLVEAQTDRAYVLAVRSTSPL